MTPVGEKLQRWLDELTKISDACKCPDYLEAANVAQAGIVAIKVFETVIAKNKGEK